MPPGPQSRRAGGMWTARSAPLLAGRSEAGAGPVWLDPGSAAPRGRSCTVSLPGPAARGCGGPGLLLLVYQGQGLGRGGRRGRLWCFLDHTACQFLPSLYSFHLWNYNTRTPLSCSASGPGSQCLRSRGEVCALGQLGGGQSAEQLLLGHSSPGLGTVACIHPGAPGLQEAGELGQHLAQCGPGGLGSRAGPWACRTGQLPAMVASGSEARPVAG